MIAFLKALPHCGDNAWTMWRQADLSQSV